MEARQYREEARLNHFLMLDFNRKSFEKGEEVQQLRQEVQACVQRMENSTVVMNHTLAIAELLHNELAKSSTTIQQLRSDLEKSQQRLASISHIAATQ